MFCFMHFSLSFRSTLVGLFAVLMSTHLWSQTPKPVVFEQAGHGIVVSHLANGLTVVVKPLPRAPTAVHMLWVRVGSMDEVDGYTGLAHMLEHMMFKGTPSVPAGEFSRKVAALGGRENAFTDRDFTGYFQQIPSSRLSDVMKLEADRFAHNIWPDEEFKKSSKWSKKSGACAPMTHLVQRCTSNSNPPSGWPRPIADPSLDG